MLFAGTLDLSGRIEEEDEEEEEDAVWVWI